VKNLNPKKLPKPNIEAVARQTSSTVNIYFSDPCCALKYYPEVEQCEKVNLFN
jgi:hypothetical protein